MVLVISFLTQFIFFPILLSGLNLLLQTNTTQLSYWEWDPPSLHPNCHHKISSINCNVKFEYPLLYEGLIWDYKRANIQLIHRTIENFNREKLFESKNVHGQVYLFNKIILNIFHKSIPNKIIQGCKDKDTPCFNDEIRQTLNKRNELFK